MAKCLPKNKIGMIHAAAARRSEKTRASRRVFVESEESRERVIEIQTRERKRSQVEGSTAPVAARLGLIVWLALPMGVAIAAVP